jgi:hypothetical protein
MATNNPVPSFLRSEVVPYASLEVFHADGRVTVLGAPVVIPDCPTCDGYAFAGHVCPGTVQA